MCRCCYVWLLDVLLQLVFALEMGAFRASRWPSRIVQPRFLSL